MELTLAAMKLHISLGRNKAHSSWLFPELIQKNHSSKPASGVLSTEVARVLACVEEEVGFRETKVSVLKVGCFLLHSPSKSEKLRKSPC